MATKPLAAGADVNRRTLRNAADVARLEAQDYRSLLPARNSPFRDIGSEQRIAAIIWEGAGGRVFGTLPLGLDQDAFPTRSFAHGA